MITTQGGKVEMSTAVLDSVVIASHSKAVAGLLERMPLPVIRNEDDDWGDWDDWGDGDEHADSDND